MLEENGKNLKVLFVESHAGTRLKLGSILKQFFGQVHTCAYAKDALMAFNNTKFDLIVTDCYLPDMKVQDILSQIKDIAAKKPIIVVSNINNIDSIINLMNMGVNGYIQTPIDVDKVLPLLTRVANDIADMYALYVLADADYVERRPQDKMPNITEETYEKIDERAEIILANIDSMSAKELIEAYPLDLEVVGDKLLEINDELDLNINKFIYNSSEKNALEIARNFEAYSNVLETMEFFANVALATKRLSSTFENLNSDSNYEEYYDMIFSMSKSLNQWCAEIFIEQSSPSVYFMDKSILADSLMIENMFLNNEEKTGDVEFF